MLKLRLPERTREIESPASLAEGTAELVRDMLEELIDVGKPAAMTPA